MSWLFFEKDLESRSQAQRASLATNARAVNQSKDSIRLAGATDSVRVFYDTLTESSASSITQDTNLIRSDPDRVERFLSSVAEDLKLGGETASHILQTANIA